MSIAFTMPPKLETATMPASPTIDVRAPTEHEEGSRSQVLRWLKAVGDRVAQDEPLIEIETDKVTVEIAAPASGVLAEILRADGEEIAPGDVLARMAVGDTAEGGDTAAVRTAATRASTATTASSPSEGTSPSGIAEKLDEPMDPGPVRHLQARAALSPAVKRLIAELGLDPVRIRGSGDGGRVTVDDVLQFASARRDGGATAPHVTQTALWEDTTHDAPADGLGPAVRRLPHSATRKRIAEHMVRSLLHTAPHVTTVFEADFSAVLAHRARHRDEFAGRGVPLTLTAYFLTACVDAIRAVPEANARWTDEALELLEPIHIGIGTAIGEKGLIVPVVRHVETLDLFGAARELGRLVALAREDRLTPADVRGGTFTISNHGVSGSLLAAPIVINQPQVAILGIGKVEKRPVVIEESGEDRLVARSRCYITLTIDHRVMDGHRANRFLEALVNRIESWPNR